MKFRFEEPSIERKQDALDYIKEHIEAGSDVNGSGSLDSYYPDYEGWLELLETKKNAIVTENTVPAITRFLVDCESNRIIGMINIRLQLNERLRSEGGNIGYGIRPSERRKGYNKINLYMGLKLCNLYGIEEVLLDALVSNEASWKTMEALGGKRIKEYMSDGDLECRYIINVKDALDKYKDIYEPFVEE